MCREVVKSGVACGVMADLPGQHVEVLAIVSHARTPACNFSSIRVVILKIQPIRGEGWRHPRKVDQAPGE